MMKQCMVLIQGVLVFLSPLLLIGDESVREFRNALDGIIWTATNEVRISKPYSLTANTHIEADRIIFSQPLYTEGYALTLVAKELIFDYLKGEPAHQGMILSFSKPPSDENGSPLIPKKPEGWPQAPKGEDDVRDDLIRSEFAIQVKDRAQGSDVPKTAISEKSFQLLSALAYQIHSEIMMQDWRPNAKPRLVPPDTMTYSRRGQANQYLSGIPLKSAFLANTANGRVTFNAELLENVLNSHLGEILSKQDIQQVIGDTTDQIKKIEDQIKEAVRQKKSPTSKRIDATIVEDILVKMALDHSGVADIAWPGSAREFGSRYRVFLNRIWVMSGKERRNGKNGVQGRPGERGIDARQDAQPIRIIAEVVRGSAIIIGKGQRGGKGGPGGDGQQGGHGGKGANGYWEPFDIVSPTPGGLGGRGGDGGPGGKGGRGGSPVPVYFVYDRADVVDSKESTLADLKASWKVVSEAGDPGDPGDSGTPGVPGVEGPGGDKGGIIGIQVGHSAGKSGDLGSGRLWVPDRAERMALTGDLSPVQPITDEVSPPQDFLDARDGVINYTFQLQLERNRWALTVQTIGFLYELTDLELAKAAMSDNSWRPSEDFDLVEVRVKSVLAAWKTHLSLLESAIHSESSRPKTDTPWLAAYLKTSELIVNALRHLDPDEGLRAQAPDLQGLMNELRPVRDDIRRHLETHVQVLSDLCDQYQKAWSELTMTPEVRVYYNQSFSIPLCSTRGWLKDSTQILRVNQFKPLRLEGLTASDAVEIFESETPDQSTVMPKSLQRFLISARGASSVFADDLHDGLYLIRLSAEDLQKIRDAIPKQPQSETLLRAHAKVAALTVYPTTSLANVDDLRAKLTFLLQAAVTKPNSKEERK